MNIVLISVKLQSHPYVKDNEACRPIVIEALRFLCDLDVNDREVDLTHPLARPRIPHEVKYTNAGSILLCRGQSKFEAIPTVLWRL